MRISRPSQFFKALGFTAALPISASLLIISMGKAQASGQFSKTCDYIDIKAKPYTKKISLIADCKKRDGSYNYNTSIDLNELITNNDGNLYWQSHGDFGESCEWEALTTSSDSPDEFVMITSCRNRNGQNVKAYIDLNEHIANINGVLTYVK